MSFQPSEQQAEYFDWITNGVGSAILEAVAGAGKTTTLIEGLKLMKGDIYFGAFNKKIADEIKSKTYNIRNVNVSTLHAAGLALWKTVVKFVNVDAKKCDSIFSYLFGEREEYFKSAILSLVSYAKQAAFGAIMNPTEDDRMDMIDHYNVECLDEPEHVIDLAKRVLSESIKRDSKCIDFDDMIYAPLVHKVKPKKEYDWVLIDEAQDTNAARRSLSLLLLKRGGRLVAVGDRHQAIYGFTGADSDALDLIAQAVDAIRIPLTTTYRCPKKVVTEAKRYVNHIESHESSPEGSVSSIGSEEIFKTAKPGDVILCRFNAPIIQLAFKFIGEGIAAKVEGRDIGSSLKSLATRWKTQSFHVLQSKLEAYRDKETAKYRMKQKESLAVQVEDKVLCLNIIIERVLSVDPHDSHPVKRVCEEIDKIFGDNLGNNVIILSSIHKSKGREWERVFWLQTGVSKWARKEWEKQQEHNLCYVAVTRSKNELFYVLQDDEKVKK